MIQRSKKRESVPELPVDVDTPQAPEKGRGMPTAGRMAARKVPETPEKEEVLEDASDAGEVFLCREAHPHSLPPMENPHHLIFPTVSCVEIGCSLRITMKANLVGRVSVFIVEENCGSSNLSWVPGG